MLRSEGSTVEESQCRRRFDTPADRSCVFYKLIVSSALQDKKLKIPGRFVNKFGDELSTVVTLTLPNSHIWFVGLRKAEHKLWFDKGWHEFVQYYSISIGYFLVFRYEGNSNFDVYIYDLPVYEILYPSKTVSSSEVSNHDNHCLGPHMEDKDGAIVENKDLKLTVRSTRDIGTQYGSELTETTEILQFSNEATRRSRRSKQRTGLNEHELATRKKVRVDMPTKALTRRWRIVTNEEKERAFRAADMFKPANPFFKVILRPSYVYRGFQLHIPSSFARTYLQGVSAIINLQISDGKQWPVRCTYQDESARLCKGWTEFVWDNKLEEGDICVFELVKMSDIILIVTIFRALEDAGPVNQPPN